MMGTAFVRRLPMRSWRHLEVFALVVGGALPHALAKDRKPPPAPTKIEIGRHTFIDVGPPNDFYDIFIATAFAGGTSMERISLTPATDSCSLPKFEEETKVVPKPISELLEVNACAIPEKALRKETGRCKKCMTFSGEHLTMRASCGGKSRVFPAKLLDRDIFDARTKTPSNTSRLAHIVSNLEQYFSGGPLNQPLLSMRDSKPSAKADALLAHDLESGAFDELFSKAFFNDGQSLGKLYQSSQKHLVGPSVTISVIGPIQPISTSLPYYPAIARAAHLEGPVEFSFDLDASGKPGNFLFQPRQRMFAGAISGSVASWKFPSSATVQHEHGTIVFNLNCPQTSP